MSLPAFKPSQRRLLVGSAIALALFATPFSYDFSHHQWQLNQAYAKSCFVAGTRILMADGEERPIETLQVGERVRSIWPQQPDPGDRTGTAGSADYTGSTGWPLLHRRTPLADHRGWAAIARP